MISQRPLIPEFFAHSKIAADLLADYDFQRLFHPKPLRQRRRFSEAGNDPSSPLTTASKVSRNFL
jgi:hypothetical protein